MKYSVFIYIIKKKCEKILLLIFFSCFLNTELRGQTEDDACAVNTLNLCLQQLQMLQQIDLSTTQQQSIIGCSTNLRTAYFHCSKGNQLTLTALSNSTGVQAMTDTSNLEKIKNPMEGGAATTTAAATEYQTCSSATSTATPDCAVLKQAAACQTYVKFLTKKCPGAAADATKASAQQSMLAKAGNFLTSKEFLVGAAAGALGGYLVGKNNGKGGGGGNNPNTPEVKPPADNDKLKPLNTGGTGSSSSSSSSGPNIVYYDKGTPNNNGSLGNPAVTSSSTTTKPSDAVTVASITPSSSFGSGQSSSSDGLDSNGTRTLSGSGMNSLSGGSSGGGGLGSGSGGSEGESESNSAAGSLVDTSKGGSGGGNATSGGIDGGGGSGNAQGSSADGTMLTGVLRGKDKNALKKKSLALKKSNSAPSNIKQTKLSVQKGQRRIANSKQTPVVKNEPLLQSFQKRGLLNRAPVSPKQ